VIVVDASVTVKWFVEEEGHLSALSLLEPNLVLIAPDLIFPETANVLWKKLRRGEVTPEQAERACRALPNFFEGIVTAASLIEDALMLAKRLDHPVYDCVYLACAQQQGTKLVTADRKFVSHLKDDGLGHLAVALDDAAALTHAESNVGLSISAAELTRVLALSDQFRRTLSFIEEQVAKAVAPGGIKWVNAADLTPAFDSPARRRLEQAVSSLPHNNVGDLVALAWLGRGFDGNDWAYLRDNARGMLGNDPLQHLGYIISLLIHVEDGIEKLSVLRRLTQDQSDPDAKPET
jgi:predicted nucleic acid-binding protein